MAKMIFVSLPVSDVARSTAFYQAIGLTGNAQFSDHATSCLVFDPSPVDDFDFMYGRSFEDPDGHMWGVSWMDVEAAAKAMAALANA